MHRANTMGILFIDDTCFNLNHSALPDGRTTMLRPLGLWLLLVAMLLEGCSSPDQPGRANLLNPQGAGMNETAPATYKVLFTTSKGDFTLEVHRDWAPMGADRFYNL